jgi:tetratricopeptide (TPR) repeat protein
MNLEKLKDTARKFEQKEDWRKAIEVYLRAIEQIESGAETAPDLSLYNRVGDLHLKVNDTAAAVRSYERAVDLYADQGFFNNAIALCGKILRVNPGRTQTYLKLAQLHARKNVVIEAKRNLIEFLERMNALGQLDQAFQSVKEFADQFSGSQEIRLMLIELLRAASREEEAREQLDKLAGELESHGEQGAAPRAREPTGVPETRERRREAPAALNSSGLVFLDTGLDLPSVAPARGANEATASPVSEAAPPDGLMVTEPMYGSGAPEPQPQVPGLERTPELDLDAPGLGQVGPPAELDRTEPVDLEPEETTLMEIEGELEVVETPLVSLDDELSESLAEPEFVDAAVTEPDLGLEEPADLPLIPVEGPTAPSIAELESRVLDDPENPELHGELADRLLLAGERSRGLEELELALAGFERAEDWRQAAGIADRLVALSSETIRYHQKRVELAYRTGHRDHLLEAYLSLADLLVRIGATDKATAVYGRVQEHDPENARAAAALAEIQLQSEIEQETAEPEPPPVRAPVTPPAIQSTAQSAPPPAPAPPPSPAPHASPAPPEHDASFVDLSSMIFEESTPRDTRMRIDRREPQDEDEQREFKEILEQFKRGIEQNLDTEDYQAHYDLGVAFKEMGLLDEAISEFQKALRAPEGRLRTSEALGICFFQKGQPPIAEAVLRRAVDTLTGGDDAKIGLLYWLGRALEAQGKETDALASYERALAVDIRFLDLSDRIHRLAAGRRQ